jgi:hypothetical protein
VGIDACRQRDVLASSRSQPELVGPSHSTALPRTREHRHTVIPSTASTTRDPSLRRHTTCKVPQGTRPNRDLAITRRYETTLTSISNWSTCSRIPVTSPSHRPPRCTDGP